MEINDLLELLKQRIENGEDAEKVFEENKHLFKKAETDNKEFWQKSGKDEMYDVDIRIYRKPGMGNAVQMINGNDISIMTATTSLLQTLLINNIWPNKKQLLKDLDDMLEDNK